MNTVPESIQALPHYEDKMSDKRELHFMQLAAVTR